MPSRNRIRSLDVVLTAQCNLRCEYCYQNSKNPARMTRDTLFAALDLLLASERTRLDVGFYGGEPLLEARLLRQGVEYLERNRGHREVSCTVSTNGLLLDQDSLAFLVDHGFRVQLSFDGVEAAQRRRGSGTFESSDALLDRLACRHPIFLEDNVQVSITLTGATVVHLSDSVAYFIRKGVRDLQVSPRFSHDPEWGPGSIVLLDEQFQRVARICLEHYCQTGAVALALFRKTGDRAHCRPARLGMCGIDRGEALTVDVDGSVSGCVTLAESYQRFPTPLLAGCVRTMRLGDVHDPGLINRLREYPESVRNAGIFTNKQDKHSSYGRCGECPYLGACSVCPVSIGHIPGNTDPNRIPDFPCAFQLVALKYRDGFPAQADVQGWLLGDARVPDLAAELLQGAGQILNTDGGTP